MQPAVVPVELGDHSYDVTIQPGLLAGVGARVSPLTGSRKVAIVTDSAVGPLYLDALRQSFAEAGIEPIVATLPTGEDHKTLADLLPCYDAFLGARIDRKTPVIALGGGVVGDMTGFVAATLLRGVPFVQVPTTLLAMVDASVGGKTGINHPVGKNLIGAFHQPVAVLIDPEVLKTLPPREVRGGLAECIKHDCIRDADGFANLERDIQKALRVDVEFLTTLIAHNVAIKASVVEADPFEHGARAHLNFGHTFGHAIETVSRYACSHGESVALGMTAAAYASAKLGLIDETARKRIVALIDQAGLPTRGLTLDPGAVEDAMHFDKKASAGKLRFVLLDRIGHALIRDDVPGALVREAVESLRD